MQDGAATASSGSLTHVIVVQPVDHTSVSVWDKGKAFVGQVLFDLGKSMMPLCTMAIFLSLEQRGAH